MQAEQLLEYASCLKEAEHQHVEALEASYREASRYMSLAGLSTYLEGMRAICSLGRGHELILTYVEEMPAVARELGEDALSDIVTTCMMLANRVAKQTLVLLLSEMPLVARRLGDTELLRGYLKLVQRMATSAPRGIRPMLENMDELLAKLTLGGLHRWATWGARAHTRDPEGQRAYFALNTESSRTVFKKERSGTLLIDNQRRLLAYLRALWGQAFVVKPAAGDLEKRNTLRPFIEEQTVYLPDAVDDFLEFGGMDLYRASATHCVAHLMHTTAPFDVEGFSVAQMACIDVFEDARVEYLVTREFPGLGKLWASLCARVRLDGLDEAVRCLVLLARLLSGEIIADAPDFLRRNAERYRLLLKTDAEDSSIALQAGLILYKNLLEHTAMPPLSVLEANPIPYRDDNRFCWQFGEDSLANYDMDLNNFEQREVRREVEEVAVPETPKEITEVNADEMDLWTRTEAFWRTLDSNDPDGLDNPTPVSDPFHYGEWDYNQQAHRPDWVTLFERRQTAGDPQIMANSLETHKPVANRIRHLIDALQPQGITRYRGYEDGDELDLNAAIQAMIDYRRGITPDPRINTRLRRHVRDIAIVVLLDLSQSTNDRVKSDSPDEVNQQTVLSLTREATGLLAWAINGIGDPFAIHGFASDSRHDVQYYRFKEFDQAYDERVQARMAGMSGSLSTRMGPALRHAGEHLLRQPAKKKLILMISDGEPADIDELDPQYLRHDAQKAVEENKARGISTFCLTLDKNADNYVATIFGANRYSIVDNVKRLPERLSKVFASLTS